VEGNLQVDGGPFSPTRCRSGQTGGFPGIELADDQGRRLRLAQNIDGTPSAAYLPPGSPIGENLSGACGAVAIYPGTGMIGGIRNMDGRATLSCGTAEHSVVGAVRFENCH
jgi:hypothetical protein